MFAYWFKGWDGLPILMAWHASGGEVEHEFKVDKGAVLVDMLGKVGSLEVSDRKVKVTLSEAPVYIVPLLNKKAREVEKVLAE